jgi:membrane-associated protein
VFDRLIEAMSSSSWTYLLVLAVCGGDAVLPLLPGETMVVTGGVLAATGELNVVFVMIAGAVGAFLGDTASYWLGRRFGPAAASLLLRGKRGQRSLDWARRTLQRRGMLLIVVARFVPGGRTATTFAAGTTDFPWPRFAVAAGLGGCLWSVYNALLGAVGGNAFQRQTWKGLLLAFGLAAGSALVIEAVRWVLSRRARRRAGATQGPTAGAGS